MLQSALWHIASEEMKQLRAGDGANPTPGPAPRAHEAHNALRDALVTQATRVMDLFHQWDLNGDGVITFSEFLRALPELGLWADPSEAQDLFDSFDIDRSGTISFRELNHMLRRTRVTDQATKVRATGVESCTNGPKVTVVDVHTLRQQTFRRVRMDAVQGTIYSSLKGQGDDYDASDEVL